MKIQGIKKLLNLINIRHKKIFNNHINKNSKVFSFKFILIIINFI